MKRKRTYRLYRAMRLQARQHKRLARARIASAVPDHANERWSLDFVSDQLAGRCRFRVLNGVDNYSRECFGQLVDACISGAAVALPHELSGACKLPRALVLDNGPKFT